MLFHEAPTLIVEDVASVVLVHITGDVSAAVSGSARLLLNGVPLPERAVEIVDDGSATGTATVRVPADGLEEPGILAIDIYFVYGDGQEVTIESPILFDARSRLSTP